MDNQVNIGLVVFLILLAFVSGFFFGANREQLVLEFKNAVRSFKKMKRKTFLKYVSEMNEVGVKDLVRENRIIEILKHPEFHTKEILEDVIRRSVRWQHLQNEAFERYNSFLRTGNGQITTPQEVSLVSLNKVL